MKSKSFYRIVYQCSVCNSEFIRTFQSKSEVYKFILCYYCKNQCYSIQESIIKRDLTFNTLLILNQKKVSDFK